MEKSHRAINIPEEISNYYFNLYEIMMIDNDGLGKLEITVKYNNTDLSRTDIWYFSDKYKKYTPKVWGRWQ